MHYSFQNPCINQQTKYMFIVIMTKKGTTKFVTFMTPGAGVLVVRCGYISHIGKMHYSSPLPYIDLQIKYIVMMTKKGSTTNLNFMTPREEVFVLGRGRISHMIKMHYCFKNFLFHSHALIRQTNI